MSMENFSTKGQVYLRNHGNHMTRRDSERDGLLKGRPPHNDVRRSGGHRPNRGRSRPQAVTNRLI